MELGAWSRVHGLNEASFIKTLPAYSRTSGRLVELFFGSVQRQELALSGVEVIWGSTIFEGLDFT